MATKKKDSQRHLTVRETKQLHDAVDDARRLAWKMANDERYYPSTRKYINSLLKDLQKAQRSANWARMSNYTYA